jgi:hypothetical protein
MLDQFPQLFGTIVLPDPDNPSERSLPSAQEPINIYDLI